MNLTILDILRNYDSSFYYEDDYRKKETNSVYNIEESQLDLDDILVFLNNNNLFDDIIKEINSIDKKYLYSSFNHGYYHNERVLLFGYLIGKERKLNDINMKILMDACKYHDIGRVNDIRDDIHGLISSNKIDKVIENDEFYKNPENLKLLKCAIEYHSTFDKYLEPMIENYEINDKESAKEIMKILKDADGLDRVRLSMGRTYSDLDPSFLRTKEAKRLIKASHQLNELYLKVFKEKTKQNDLDEVKKNTEGELYLHSVGLDFFKFESILNNGILSKNELLKRNILSSKNFDGCNFEDYISVAIYGNEYYSPNNSYNNHVRGNIIFCISNIEAFDGHKTTELTVEDYKNRSILLPINMGGYADERFVKEEIPIEKIDKVIIPKNILNLKLTDINYISSSLSFDAIESQINYYTSIVESKWNQPINREEFKFLVNSARSIEEKRKRKEISSKDFQDELYSFSKKMNYKIGLMVDSMYKSIFNKEDVNIGDVVEDILERNKLNISMDDENFLYINLGETKKLQ
ncbi:MAG: hypothetical protein PHR09_03500 [Bacilli bacterium]|nr:hypothetical protein [Bacilli bacterium]